MLLPLIFGFIALRRRGKRDWVVISRADYRNARRDANRSGVLAP